MKKRKLRPWVTNTITAVLVITVLISFLAMLRFMASLESDYITLRQCGGIIVPYFLYVCGAANILHKIIKYERK